MIKHLLIIIPLSLLIAACTGSNKGVEVNDHNIQTVDTLFYNQLKQDSRGTVLVVNVFASWCPPCEEETPDFIRLYESSGGSFKLVGLSIDDSLADLNAFIDKHGISYPVYRIKKDVQRMLRASRVPTTIIYRPDGTMYKAVLGMIDAKGLAALVKEAAK